MSNKKVTIGSRIREQRKSLRFSQAQMGKIGGVSGKTQGYYERDERQPSASYFERIAKEGFDINYIITGEGSPSSLYAIHVPSTNTENQEVGEKVADYDEERARSFSPKVGLKAAEKLADYERLYDIDQTRRVDCYEVIYMSLYIEEHMGMKQKHLDVIIESMGREPEEALPVLEQDVVEKAQANK